MEHLRIMNHNKQQHKSNQDRKGVSEAVDNLVAAVNAGSVLDWLRRQKPLSIPDCVNTEQLTFYYGRRCGHIPHLSFSDIIRVLMAED